ncbi:ankyrin repeat-containing domain protein [Aspergillus cavernicola]|uniref:Ankyrin repeat-containing domain protein n=1 Tax=Aspergillus cavernicola TaxID=176166 RepID=A0ABR4I397_9EURO
MSGDDFVFVENPNELLHPVIDPEDKVEQVTPEDIAAIRSWLSPTEFDSDGSEYRKHLNAHAPGTGDWVLQADSYTKWHDSPAETTTGALWIQGIPGSGKSVVTARLIQTLQMNETAPVAFFFARRIIKSNSRPHYLVRDCLYQLLEHSDPLQARLNDMRQDHASIDNTPFQELWGAFVLALDTIPRAYVVFDALDELAVDENEFLPLLLELGQRNPRSIKLIITSRPVSHLLDVLKGPSLEIIRLTKRVVETDIATYIAHRLSQQQQRLLTEEDQSLVNGTLCSKAQGLFLYARLMLDQLMRQPTTPVDVHLQRLPGTLEEMYVNLLHEHAASSGAGVRFQSWLLSWITHASRPLRVTELATLIRSTADRGGLNSGQDAKLMVRTACGPLIEILDNETVQIIHHSFTEFLLDSRRASARECDRWFPAFTPCETHRALSLTTINYLLSGCFASWTALEATYDGDGFEKAHMDLLVQFPFLQYAVQNLLYHAANCDIDNVDLMQALDRLFEYGTDDFNAWKDFWFASMAESVPDGFRPLHVAAHAGLTKYTAHLLGRGEDPNALDARNRTPTAYAAIAGHAETVDALLSSQAMFTGYDRGGLAPIHHAAKGNHVRVLQRLLDAGADPLYPQSPGNMSRLCHLGQTSVEHACERGHVEATSVLVTHMDAIRRSCLLPHWAAVDGQADTLAVLLEYPEIRANVAAKDAWGNTALYLAACAADSATVRLLLDHGADIHARSSGIKPNSNEIVSTPEAVGAERWTPLQGWANGISQWWKKCHTSIDEWEQTGKLLIGAGSDLDTRDDEGKTILFYWSEHRALSRGSDNTPRFVSFLLRHGANVRAIDHQRSTVLHGCPPYYNASPAMQLLVKAGADINHARKGDGVTPLIAAAKRQFLDLKLFVDCGADPNLQDSDGNTALHYICSSWIPGLSELQEWLSFADPTIRNRKGQTCVYNLRFGNGGHERVQAVPLFVKKGVDLEQRDRRGRTALLAACENRQQHFITGLLGYGASATATDFENKTCLHIVAQDALSTIDYGKADFKVILDVMTQLIEGGANINAVDHHGNNPFHEAIATDQYFPPVKVRLDAILKLGGLPNMVDNQGRTALHKIALLDGIPCSDRLDYLLQGDSGLDLHTRDHQWFMPIHCAASAGDVNVCKFAQAGADMQARTVDGRGVLHHAAGAAQSSALGFLCELYRDNGWEVDERDENGRSPLHCAARAGSSECVFHLLQAGANPNTPDHRGLTPLHVAAEYQINHISLRQTRRKAGFPYGRGNRDSQGLERFMDLRRESPIHTAKESVRSTVAVEEEVQMIQDVLRLLISSGADPGLPDSSGWTAYDLAVFLNHEEMASMLQPLTQSGGRELSLPARWCSIKNVSADRIVEELNIDDCDHYTLLHTAICEKNETLLKAVLEAGVDPTVSGPDALTPVHYAVFWGLVSVMELMKPYIKDWNCFNPPLLHAAASREQSNLQMVDLLIGVGVNINAHFEAYVDKHVHMTAATTYTAAHILAPGERWWYISALDTLCKAGADLEATDSRGRTVLQCALTTESMGRRCFWQDQALDVVLRHGANINAASEDGSTALQRALRSQLGRPMIDRLLRHGADINLGEPPAIFAAVESMDADSCAALLDAGADPNVIHRPTKQRYYGKGPQLETPLLAAAMKDWYEFSARDLPARIAVLSLLLQRGADPFLALPGQKTTVFHEVCYQHGVISPFVTAAIDLECANTDGLTPLLVACFSPKVMHHRFKDESTPIQLILAGANIHATDPQGSTPLHLATQSGLCETVSLLLEKGASVSATDKTGLTPLYHALSYGNEVVSLQLIKTLLSAGAASRVTGPNGESTLHLLAPALIQLSPGGSYEQDFSSRDNTDYLAEFKTLYKNFVDNGCEHNALDNEGNTPLFPYVQEVKEGSEIYAPDPPAEDDVREMLDAHDVFAVNKNGDTLLHAVAGREDFENTEENAVWLFQELVARGLDARQENEKGLSALDVAMAYNKQGILRLFAREE